MNRIKLSLAACCTVALNLYAQRATDEQPYGLHADFRAQAQDVVVLAAPDMARIEKEDLEYNQQPGPVPYAYPVSVNFTPENSGVWQQLPDGSKLWRLKVNMPGSLSTITYFMTGFGCPKAPSSLYTARIPDSLSGLLSPILLKVAAKSPSNLQLQ